MKLKYLITLISTAFIGLFSQKSFAQTDTTTNLATSTEEILSNLKLTGSIDTYFRTNLNNTNDALSDGSYSAPTTSFANKPGFSLGMANLVLSYEKDNVGFVADLVVGPRGSEAVFNSNGSAEMVNQLYAYWNVNDAVTFTMGNFNTYLGYEVISPVDNFNYSTTYAFSYGPFSHTGLKADIALNKKWSLMLGVFNPTDITEFNTSDEYYGGIQLGYSVDKGSAYLNGLIADGFYQVDLTSGIDLTDKLFTGLNATYASDAFYGVTSYWQYSISEKTALGIRGEYFADEGVGALTKDENVIDVTLSMNYKVGNLTLIPEFRADIQSYDGYMTESGAYQKSLASFLLGAVYSF